MNKHTKELEIIANEILIENSSDTAIKPNYTNREFMNACIIFHNALMDKMYDNQDFDDMLIDDRMNMATSCGTELRNLIRTYTGLDTHEVDKFL
jgi:hypothetical protein